VNKTKRSRDTFEELTQKYNNLKEVTNTFRRAFEQTSKKDEETREKIFREYFNAFLMEKLCEIDLLERLSPLSAKNLRNSLVNWKEQTLEGLKNDYSSIIENKFMPEENRKNLISEMKNNFMDIIANAGMSLRSNFIDIALESALQAIKNSGNKLRYKWMSILVVFF
jgi:hypothetical protein